MEEFSYESRMELNEKIVKKFEKRGSNVSNRED